MPKNEVLCSNGDVLWVDVEVASHQQCGPSFRVPIKVSSDSPEFVAKFNLIKLMDNFDENSDYSSVTKGKFSQSPMSDCYTVGFLPPNVGLINFAQQTSEQSIVILDEIRNYLQKKSLSNRVFTVSGRSGAGKSRLIIEACRRVGLSVTRCHRPLNPKEFKSSVLILKVDSLMDEDDLFYREVREYVDMDGRGTCLFIVHPLETTESTVHIRMYKLVTFSWKIDSFIFAGEENFQKLCSDKRIHGGSFSVRWGDIGGLEEAKKMLIESLDFASINFSKIGYKKKEFFPRNNLDSGEVEACLDQLSELQIVQSHGFQKTYQESQKFGQKKQSKLGRRCGVLLHGPPGTGKTMLAQGFSELVGCSFLPVKGPELLNMYVGESEARVRETFLKAREMQPCIIFFDEIDSLAASRGGRAGDFSDRLVSQLAIELDRIAFDESIEVFVIGATNRADLIDPVLLRPGRLEKLVYLAAPETSEQQAEILKMTANRFDRQATVKADRFAKIDWYEVSRRLVKSVSPADLANIVNCSMKLALKRYLNRGSVVSGDVIIVEPFDVEHVISPFISK